MSHVPLKWLDLRKIYEIICRSISLELTRLAEVFDLVRNGSVQGRVLVEPH